MSSASAFFSSSSPSMRATSWFSWSAEKLPEISLVAMDGSFPASRSQGNVGADRPEPALVKFEGTLFDPAGPKQLADRNQHRLPAFRGQPSDHGRPGGKRRIGRSEAHTSELQSLMRT